MVDSIIHHPNPNMAMDVVIVGGGMIVNDQILPSLYHMQRLGMVQHISVCATSTANLRDLVNPRFEQAFPGRKFKAYPDLSQPPNQRQPDLYRRVVAALKPGNMVIIAAPDALHDAMVRFALEQDQHVLCVKPLVQKIEHARVIETMAKERGRLVAVEYHKRFDRRSLEARKLYRQGHFGEFRLGEAKLIEPYYYRRSNFQNWFIKDGSDPFTYVGCHYVDLVYFITGLKPVEVSVHGVEGKFPNGNDAWLWSSGTVKWENGALLSLLNGLGYPELGAGTNDQGMTLYCDDGGRGAVIKHDDQFRGVSHAYADDAAGAWFRYINPDYFRLLPWLGEGLQPVGYGYDSIFNAMQAAIELNRASQGLSSAQALTSRQDKLAYWDEQGLLATPANSYINELVVEAGRLSIANQGRTVAINYQRGGSVAFRE